MTVLIIISFIFLPMQNQILFDFRNTTDISTWQIINDGVMGGRSKGNFGLNPDGNGIFSGFVSLENNGGFSLVRHRLNRTGCAGKTKFVIRLKGDGKRYQFRVRADASSSHAYVCYFNTTGNWQNIEISFSDLYPVFRGRRLNQPNFSGEVMEEIGFLIGNKKEEHFLLEIDKIEIK